MTTQTQTQTYGSSMKVETQNQIEFSTIHPQHEARLFPNPSFFFIINEILSIFYHFASFTFSQHFNGILMAYCISLCECNVTDYMNDNLPVL